MAMCLPDVHSQSNDLSVALRNAPWRKTKRACSCVDNRKVESQQCLRALQTPHKLDVGSLLQSSARKVNVAVLNAAPVLPQRREFQVTITHLPERLLTRSVVEAMIEQAVQDGSILRLSIEGSMASRKVVALFSTCQDAQCCVQHFHGRQWDRDGLLVQAEMSTERSAASRSRSPVKVVMPTLDAQSLALDVTCPAFIDSLFCTDKFPIASACSDASTELGESETEDESSVQ